MTIEKKYTKQQKQYRKKLLKKILPLYGLQYRGDSSLLTGYIKGRINFPILKIVNIMKKSSYRHSNTNYDEEYIKYRPELEETIEFYMKEGYSIKNAKRLANIKWKKKILQEIFQKYGGYEKIPVITEKVHLRKK